ncbi:molybdenum cofactor biosynthesis protein MoaE [Flavihumibacter sp. CACIAM 22H1]|uniref:molybdenum cofactor biosynthesis protein MoaE n=1 Tax=Flavihumibacter sp. CACIAM 22H1 TaxID=1812911 RepID=UPI0007A7C3BD|nr:molybdenum cofactor biosynthesis protein MoaE [Flavihumibacter sp. CACIAM 22H1]KYP14710.1 MAG: molybdopterin converting factor [Flavihumibacter sp. CACIAM 22H1]
MPPKEPKNIFVQGAISPGFIADKIQQHQVKTTIGAHSVFLGQVRADQVNGQLVTAIEYTSYEAMALEKMQEIRELMFEKYQLTCAHVYHSLGTVPTGEICLFVFTSAPHRKAAIDACTELVEKIKAELPVWGKELLGEQGHQWKINN